MKTNLEKLNDLRERKKKVLEMGGLKAIEKFNPPCFKIASEKCQSGAMLEATEDEELTRESMDWERFVILGFISQKVARMVSEFYLEASRKRYEHIAHRIDETLKADPFHPSLHFKKIGKYRSVRVGLHYRALAVEVPAGLLWFWIGSHSEYNRLLG